MDGNERKWHFMIFPSISDCSSDRPPEKESRKELKINNLSFWSSMEFHFSGILSSTGAQMNPMYPMICHGHPWAMIVFLGWSLLMLQPGDCNHCLYIVFASHFWEARDSLRRPCGQKTQGDWRSCSTKSRKQDWPRLRVLLLESHFRHAALLDIRVPLAAFQVSLCLTQESNSGIFIVRGTEVFYLCMLGSRTPTK